MAEESFWEAKRDGHLWALPTACVFLGVIIELAGTIILFQYDDKFIQSQNDKIIAMEARPWTKAQFDALQEVKGKVTDVGIFPEKGCLECRMFAGNIALALHAAGVRLYGDDSIDWNSGTGIMVWLPEAADMNNDPLVKALKDAELRPGWAHHVPLNWSPVRTDIPVIFVGENPPQFSGFPYAPNGQSSWTILPLRNPNFAAPNPPGNSPTNEMHMQIGPQK